MGKPDGKRPLGRPRRRWEFNTKIDLQKVGWGLGLIELARGNSCKRGNKTSGSEMASVARNQTTCRFHLFLH